jgi:phosphonate degradation associated HDIG domain protein
MLDIDAIATLFDRHGASQYSGEPVSQLDHALQTAWLAEQAGAGPELITAALLHDLGHLTHAQGETPTLRGIDDLHQYAALPFIRGLLPDVVLDAISLHVDAKRYLCATRPEYHALLSADSVRSLALQGGVFDAQGTAAFIARPGAAEAVRLRLWDDQAKTQGLATPTLAYYLDIARGLTMRAATSSPGTSAVATDVGASAVATGVDAAAPPSSAPAA